MPLTRAINVTKFVYDELDEHLKVAQDRIDELMARIANRGQLERRMLTPAFAEVEKPHSPTQERQTPAATHCDNWCRDSGKAANVARPFVRNPAQTRCRRHPSRYPVKRTVYSSFDVFSGSVHESLTPKSVRPPLPFARNQIRSTTDSRRDGRSVALLSRWRLPLGRKCRRGHLPRDCHGLHFSAGGSRFQIGGPHGRLRVVVVSGIIASYGIDGLFMPTMMAGCCWCSAPRARQRG